jgi:hypothetical protein
MKVFAVRRLAAVEPASYLRDRIIQKMRRAAAGLATLNTRVDEGRALRDRANQANRTVDRAFWIYLR